MKDKSGTVWFCVAVALVAGGWFFLRAPAEDETPDVVTEVRPSPSVVVSMRKLARLEGAVYSIERVVDLKEKQSRFFQLVEVEDAILLVAAGEVTAGVDLSGLAEDAVTLENSGKRAIVRLPRATIFSKRLDSERTYVHTRRTDALAVRRENLETRARQEAERTLEKAALEGGILKTAEESVGRTVEALTRSLGVDEVEVIFSSEGAETLPRLPR